MLLVPADKPIIKDVTHSIINNSPAPTNSEQALDGAGGQVLGPHNEGSPVILDCQTQGGYPEPKLSWWRNGQLIDDSYEIVSGLDGLVIERYQGTVSALQQGGSSSSSSSSASSLVDSASDMFAANNDNELLEQSFQENNQAEIEQQEPAAAPASEPTGSTTSSMTDSSSGARQTKQGGASNQATQNRLIRNRLELVALTRADLLANYSCQAWNTKLSEAPTSSVMIDINRKYL